MWSVKSLAAAGIAALVMVALGARASGAADGLPPVSAENLTTLTDVLDDPTCGEEYKLNACRILGRWGPRATGAAPALARRLGDERLGYAAATALRRMGRATARAAVEGERSRMPAAAAADARGRLMSRVALSAEAPEATVVAALASADEMERSAAAAVARRVLAGASGRRSDAGEGRGPMVDGLEDLAGRSGATPAARAAAAFVLLESGVASDAAVPALVAAVEGGDRALKRSAAEALGRACAEPRQAGAGAALARLAQAAAEGRDGEVHEVAWGALRAIEDRAEQARREAEARAEADAYARRMERYHEARMRQTQIDMARERADQVRRNSSGGNPYMPTAEDHAKAAAHEARRAADLQGRATHAARAGDQRGREWAEHYSERAEAARQRAEFYAREARSAAAAGR